MESCYSELTAFSQMNQCLCMDEKTVEGGLEVLSTLKRLAADMSA